MVDVLSLTLPRDRNYKLLAFIKVFVKSLALNGFESQTEII